MPAALKRGPTNVVDHICLLIVKLFAFGAIVLVLIFIVAFVVGLGVDDY